MKKIKFSNSKWFLENNGEWIEINEKDWEKVKRLVWNNMPSNQRPDNLNMQYQDWQQPTPDTEYQLNDVGFEITEEYLIDGEWQFVHRTDVEMLDDDAFKPENNKKVAHLKVEQFETKAGNTSDGKSFINTAKIEDLKVGNKEFYSEELLKEWSKDSEYDQSEYISVINKILLSHDIFYSDKVEIIKSKFQISNKQEQSEVERLREELKLINGCWQADIKQIGQLQEKIKELENEVKGLREEIEIKKAEIGSFEELVDALETKVENLESKLAEYNKVPIRRKLS